MDADLASAVSRTRRKDAPRSAPESVETLPTRHLRSDGVSASDLGAASPALTRVAAKKMHAAAMEPHR